MKRWFINELQFKMLSCNSCSLTTWSLIFQTPYSTDLWCSRVPRQPWSRACQPREGSDTNCKQNLTEHRSPAWQGNTSHSPSQINQFYTKTQRQNHFYITAQQSWKRDMTKISSVSQLCFQKLLCSVMKGAQLYHRNTALPGLHKFLKCKNLTHINTNFVDCRSDPF